MNWVAEYANKLEPLKSPNEPSIIKIDELNSYIKLKKNTTGSGLLLIEIGTGLSTLLLAQGGQKQEKSFGSQ